jgi:hypothetical protein
MSAPIAPGEHVRHTRNGKLYRVRVVEYVASWWWVHANPVRPDGTCSNDVWCLYQWERA